MKGFIRRRALEVGCALALLIIAATTLGNGLANAAPAI